MEKREGQTYRVESIMSEKRFKLDYVQSTWWRITDNITGKVIEYQEKEVVELLNEQQDTISQLKEENEQLRTQLLICQQSKNDGGFQVWEVPPIPKGMRITTKTTGEKDE